MANQKKLAAALTLALPLAALAQAAAPAAAPPAPLVQVYGTLNVNLQYTQAKDATAGEAADVSARTAISTDSTNIGVRGTADLSHGLKATYQCETQANLEGEDLRALCNRNSRVGLSSAWGTLFYGNWDTPYKTLGYGTKADDPFGNTDVFGIQGIIGSPGYGTRSTVFNTGPAAPVTAGFDIRAANSVGYWSPKFGPGVSFKLQHSVDEFRGGNGIVAPILLSGAVNVDMGGLSVGAAAEYHEDAFGIRTMSGANAGIQPSKDLAIKVAAGYELPLGPGSFNIMAQVDSLGYTQDDATTGFKSYGRAAWILGAKFRTGNHEVRARYGQALAPSIKAANGTTLAANAEDDLGAAHLTAGYAYHLAKTTQVYAFYTQISNEDRARYTFTIGGATAVVGGSTVAGADPSAFGVGIRHAF